MKIDGRWRAIAGLPSETHLLDVNVVFALAWPLHMHQAVAHAWGYKPWSTCPLTQLAFVRV